MKNTQNQPLTIGLAGRYTLEAVKADGTRRHLAEFDNLILTAGLNRIGTGALFTYAMVGTSSTAPNAGQVALGAQVANTNNLTVNAYTTEIAGGYGKVRSTWRFAQGAAAGNLTEVGCGWSTTACFSRALILDGGGSPTTVTVLADEFLDVTYEFRMYWPSADATGTITINAVNYDYVLRPANVGDWGSSNHIGGLKSNGFSWNGTDQVWYYAAGATIGDNTTGPVGAAIGTRDNSLSLTKNIAYVDSSYQQAVRLSAPLTTPTAPIGAIRVYTNLGIYKMTFSPAIPKTAEDLFTLDFLFTWARRTI